MEFEICLSYISKFDVITLVFKNQILAMSACQPTVPCLGGRRRGLKISSTAPSPDQLLAGRGGRNEAGRRARARRQRPRCAHAVTM